MLRFAIVLCLASVAYGCCAPEYFTAHTLIRAYVNESFIKGSGVVFYDYSGGIYSAFTNLTVDAEHQIFSLTSTHVDLNKGEVYIMTGGICYKTPLDKSWISQEDLPHCIPKSAKKIAQFSVGGPHEDVEMSTYMQRIKAGFREMTVTKHYCYPLQEVFYTQTKSQQGHNQRTATMSQLANLEEFIEDPSVFEIPSICFKSSYNKPPPPVQEKLVSLGFMSPYVL
ncbi:uncharacterized protein LOC115225453 [Octopus sinensis]|uniref:Uncharacterized protein LOC115225453 n=1 Tax=Octopus sinensis TaxID=2607531 RepID=A0A6P7TTQ0_9MOLL|nr:uncharacterized protein LOC115225453 [Octopus sinensis]